CSSDLDDAKFIERLKTVKVAHVDGPDGGTKAEPHTIEAPFAGTSAAIDTLTRRLFTDFQCFDSAAVSAGNQTAVAIKASYTPLDLKTDLFERCVTGFIVEILTLAGIKDRHSYTRNKIANRKEETEIIPLGAPAHDDEYITKKLLPLNGDADQFDALQRRKIAEGAQRIVASASDMPTDEVDMV